MSNRYDFAIVGGGILGCVIAYKLAKRFPKYRILLLEKTLVGDGASRFSAGLSFPYGRSDKIMKYAQASQGFYEELRLEMDSIPVFNHRLVAISNELNLSIHRPHFFLETKLTQFEQSDCEAFVFTADTFAQPAFDVAGAHKGTPSEIARILLLLSENVEVWSGAQVCNLHNTTDFAQLTLSDGREVESDFVFLCLGPWICSDSIFSNSLPEDIALKKIVAFHIPLKTQSTDPIILFLDDDAFLLPCIDERGWLFSYRCSQWDVKPDRESLAINKKDRDEAIAVLAKYVVAPGDLCQSGRVFCDAYSKSAGPLVIKQQRNVVLCGAAGGSGYRLAPGMADEAISALT